jgi:hypothetical protein
LLFRLDAVSEEELTSEEVEAAAESAGDSSLTAVIRIYEEIGEDFWTGGGVTTKKFVDELESFGEIKRLNIRKSAGSGRFF